MPPAEWKVSIMLLACIMSACATLNVVLDGIGWWFVTLVACAAVLGSAALVRLWISHRAVPALVASGLLFAYLTQQFAAQSTFAGLFPTWDTFGELARVLASGQASIQEQTVPAEATPGITLLLAGGIGLVSLICDLVAVTFRARVMTAVPLLVVLCIPVVTAQREFDLFWVMLTAISFLCLLRVGSRVPARRLSLAIGGGALALALVAQLVLPSTEPAEAGAAGRSITTGSSPIVNLGNDLRRDAERRALTYSTESGQAHYLRLVSLDQFDGEKWFVGETPLARENSPDRFGRPPGLADDVDRSDEAMWVQIANLDTPWLPLPYPATSVSGLGTGWTWDAEGLSLRTAFGSSKNQQYRVDSLVLEPTPEQLLSAGSVVPAAVASLAVIEQSEVPAIIGETARTVVGDAASHYEQALALQQYFRNGDFVYSEDAPVDEGYDGTGLDVIATFLEVKSGYCVHFASAMALMARTLGIPARVAVGFLPGDKLDERLEGRAVFEATSHDLHSWPELYFDGVGWLPFEPTAGRGRIPDYANVDVAGVPLPGAEGNPTPAPTSSSAAGDPLARDAGDNSGAGGSSGALPSGILWLIVLGLLMVLGATAPALLRAVERRSRLSSIRRGFAPAVVGWREVLQSAEDVGIAVPRTATPREGGRMLVSAISDGPPAKLAGAIEEGTAAVDRIVSLIEREGYARPAGGISVSAEDVTTAIVRLRSAVAWPARLRAFLLPPSLWRRVVEVFRPEGPAS